jgi:hypothetical protein
MRAWRTPLALWALFCVLFPGTGPHAFPAIDPSTGLPAGSDLNQDATENPTEVFHSEALRGHRSYLSNLGNLAFNSPYTLGATAQKAHMSCGTCHVNGASNPKLFIPGLSTRPGNFDTTGALFNPRADNGVLDPVTIPSLRGARFLAPYGHDGRTVSLRDFVQNVVVNEFAGAPASQEILDAMVVYIEDIDFLPNPALDAAGRLRTSANASQQRGQALFSRSFPHDPGVSCAGCHLPSAAFVDHRQHDVGSGGLFKTPTLLNANFNGPYFHDGRFDTYGQVIDHFNQVFHLKLTTRDRADLEAYLSVIGGGMRPAYHLTGINVLGDIDGFASVLDIAISTHDTEVVSLATRSVSEQLKNLKEQYPDPEGAEVSGGAQERKLARATISRLLDLLQQVDVAVEAGRFDAATAQYQSYRRLTFAAAPLALQSAEPWSLFNPTVNAAHRAALRQSSSGSTGP